MAKVRELRIASPSSAAVAKHKKGRSKRAALVNADDCFCSYVTYTTVRSFAGRQQQKQAHINSLVREIAISLDVVEFIKFLRRE
jgi:hypothetical protein